MPPPPPPSPPGASPAVNCVPQVAEEVLELNRELVAQNIWLREQLTAGETKNESVEGKKAAVDEQLRLENEQLRRQVVELESKLAKKKEIVLVSAKIIESRIAYRDNQQFVEYMMQLETDSRGTLFVWHRYSTFRKLAETLQNQQGNSRKSVPELPCKQIFGNFSEKIIQDRIIKLNQFLEAATKAHHLEWGIRVDDATCVYKRRIKSPTLPTSALRTKAWTLPTKNYDEHDYAEVVSVRVVGSQIRHQRFIEFQLQIKTDVHNTLLVWLGYSALYEWAEATGRENPSTKIPTLPKEEPFGSYSKHIQRETAKLHAFFKKVVKAGDLQWIVRIDVDTFDSKLRVNDAPPAYEHQPESASPLASISKLFPLRSIVQRQRKRSDAQLYQRKMAQAS
ncbi:hypothetical protein PHYSODRAFT_331129 [Phytophthora sojae]|uniref:PX domain-containing protein n=1 Tax=Phytophthora sojae (strain P6497) TaxID=1094619 RepID=G4ZGN6_PHYSP|nr:hypothetical protein PHYSODRAFT_331129 [Phytophthora sojae]EGZ17118.1 hypothetical protein PHYSODRAFT_331129 [Phytophthora sojae]|eukprot:XP_009526176.1 hypothetical protein PHYSODRAFT_331129 [Phytophthora sojae]